MNCENELRMKLSRGQSLGEYVHDLVLTLSILRNNHLRLNLFSYMMIVNFDMLGSFMKYQIKSNIHCDLIITKKRHRLRVRKTQIIKQCFQPHSFKSSRGYCVIFSFCIGISNDQLFFIFSRNQVSSNKYIIPVVDFYQEYFLLNPCQCNQVSMYDHDFVEERFV